MLIVIGFFGALGLVFDDHMSLGLFVFAGGVSSAVVGLLSMRFSARFVRTMVDDVVDNAAELSEKALC